MRGLRGAWPGALLFQSTCQAQGGGHGSLRLPAAYSWQPWGLPLRLGALLEEARSRTNCTRGAASEGTSVLPQATSQPCQPSARVRSWAPLKIRGEGGTRLPRGLGAPTAERVLPGSRAAGTGLMRWEQGPSHGAHLVGEPMMTTAGPVASPILAEREARPDSAWRGPERGQGKGDTCDPGGSFLPRFLLAGLVAAVPTATARHQRATTTKGRSELQGGERGRHRRQGTEERRGGAGTRNTQK